MRLSLSDLKYIAGNFFTMGAGLVVQSVLALILHSTLAVRLGSEELGVYYLAFSTVILAQRFSVLGFNRGVQRYVAMYHLRGEASSLRQTIAMSLGLTLLLSCAVSVILWSVSELISYQIYHKPQLLSSLRILILSIPLTTCSEIFMSALRALKSFRRIAVRNIALVTFQLGIFLALQFLESTARIASLSFVLGSLLVLLILALDTLTETRLLGSGNKATSTFDARALLRYSVAMSGSDYLNKISGQGTTFLMGIFLSAHEIGVFGLALRLARTPRLVLTPFNTLMAPIIVECKEKGDIHRLANYYSYTTRWAMLLSLPIASLLIVFAHPLMTLFGEEYLVGVPILAVLVLGRMVDTLAGSSTLIVSMSGFSRLVLFNTAMACAVNVVLGAVMIFWMRGMGAAIVEGMAWLTLNGLSLLQVHRLFGIIPYRWQHLKIAIAASCTISAMWMLELFFRWLNVSVEAQLWRGVLFSGSSYLLLILVVGLTRQDKELLNRWILAPTKPKAPNATGC